MPFLDVSDVLTDPDFCEQLVCQRTTVFTDLSGLGEPTVSLLKFYGVVTSDKGETLERTSVGEHAGGTISVISRFRLRDSGSGATADIVQWNNASYTVTKINDYSRYGRGLIEAICELVPLTGYAPT